MATKENRMDFAKLELNAGELSLGTSGNTKTGTSSAGAVTYAGPTGVITTESLTTAGLALYTLTVTNSYIVATDIVTVTIQGGTNAQGSPVVYSAVPSAGSLVIKIYNAHATLALNGTLVISFVTVRNT